MPAGIAEASEGFDYAMLLGSLVIVFGLMGLLGMIRPDSGPRRVEKRMRVRKRTATKAKDVSVEQDDEDIHFEEDDLDTEPIEEGDIESEEFEDEPQQEETTPVDEFEARLQRLRARRERLGGK